jgi:tetratricopeptide (TPR) repeat protein
MKPALRLFGDPRLGDGTPLPAHKPVVLLLVLAYRGDWMRREALCALLFDDGDDTTTRHGLRVLIHRAKALPWAQGLEVESDRVRWQVDSDVQEFRLALGRGDWAAALALQRAPLLDGFALPDSAGLTDWLESERAALFRAWREALFKHAQGLGAQGEHAAAATVLRAGLERDPLSEELLGAYLEQLYLSGARDTALRDFEAFQTRLRAELGLEVLPATRALMERIRLGADPNPTVSRGTGTIPLEVLRPVRLIGRAAEQARLRSADARVVLVAGEPGVGKSRFVADTFPDARRLRCQEGLEHVPYHPVIAHLRAATLPDLGAYNTDLARLLPEASPHPPPSTDPMTAKPRLLEALRRALEVQSAALHVDDLQWADAATLELLVYLSDAARCRLIVTHRAEELPPRAQATLQALRGAPGCVELRLEPLTADDLETLLAELTGSTHGPPVFSRWLWTRSGGNPFFALETLKSLFETGVLERSADGWRSGLDDLTRDYSELEVPARVAQVIERRVSKLSPLARRTLQAASVVRDGFTPSLLASILDAGLEETLTALEEIEGAGLVQGTRFAHDLPRQSVYAALSTARRTHLHARVAESLGDTAEPVVLAQHWLAAAEPERAGKLFFTAATRDLERAQYGITEANLRRALECSTSEDADTARILALLGEVLNLENAPEARTVLHRAHGIASRAGDPDLAARVLTGLVENAVFGGNKTNLEPHLREARTLLDQKLEATVEVRLLEALIEADLRDGRYAAARAHLERALQRQPDAVAMHSFAAQLDYYEGKLSAAKARFEATIHAHPAWVRVVTLENDLGMVCIAHGALPEAKTWLERSIGSWSGVPHVEALSRSNLGLAHLHCGEYSLALAQLEHAERLAQDFGSQTFLADVLHRKAGVWFGSGNVERAADLTAHALEIARAVADPFRLGYMLASASAVHCALSNLDRAEALLQETATLNATLEQPLVSVLLERSKAALATARGDTTAAQEHSAHWITLARRFEMREQLAWGLLAQGGLEHVREALEIAREAGVLEVRARAAELLGVHDPALMVEAETVREQLHAHRLRD